MAEFRPGAPLRPADASPCPIPHALRRGHSGMVQVRAVQAPPAPCSMLVLRVSGVRAVPHLSVRPAVRRCDLCSSVFICVICVFRVSLPLGLRRKVIALTALRGRRDAKTVRTETKTKMKMESLLGGWGAHSAQLMARGGWAVQRPATSDQLRWFGGVCRTRTRTRARLQAKSQWKISSILDNPSRRLYIHVRLT